MVPMIALMWTLATPVADLPWEEAQPQVVEDEPRRKGRGRRRGRAVEEAEPEPAPSVDVPWQQPPEIVVEDDLPAPRRARKVKKVARIPTPPVMPTTTATDTTNTAPVALVPTTAKDIGQLILQCAQDETALKSAAKDSTGMNVTSIIGIGVNPAYAVALANNDDNLSTTYPCIARVTNGAQQALVTYEYRGMGGVVSVHVMK